MFLADSCTDMRPDFLSSLSSSDTGVVGAETEKRGPEDKGKKVGSSTRSDREKLPHVRKRSRKRRSFMETDYTSTVSFPEPDEGCRKQVSKRHHKNMSVGYFDAQMLSTDPEPSEQTQNPSPTVSSLTHSEGEPSQLESKPILSKPGSQESFCKLRTSDKTKETQSKARKQEMEMEPDSMESKSVTDLVKTPSSTITVVRCRVDPDGKESADRTGDGKEKLEKEETIHVLENGPFDAHMFLPEVSKNESNEDKMSEALKESNLKRPLVAPEEDMSATCVNANSSDGPEQNSYIQESIFEGNSKSFFPPPAPPSSPSPVTVLQVSQSEEELEHIPAFAQSRCNNSQLETEGSANEDEALGVVSSTRTASEEVTDSTTSDNVFEDDEVSISLHSTLSDTKHDWIIATRTSIAAETGKDSGMSKSVVNTEAHTRLHSYSSDYSCDLYSITSKVGTASDVMSPTLHISAKLESKLICENETFSSDVKDCFTSPSFAKSNHLDVSSNSYSPTHFLYQAWSPSIMGRLSACTFRSKIQKMPFYLSHSLETINQAGLVSASQSPVKENAKENEITISVTSVDNVTETLDFTTESVESDESDTTVTGSDVDAVSEENEKTEESTVAVDLPLSLIQTEPEHPKQLLPFGLDTPGPVREPPTSIVSSFQPHLSLHMDTPGPVTTTPQSKMRFTQPGEDVPGIKSTSSISPSVVVTTQTLNGPGMSFQPQRTSNDKLLMGLCRPTEPLSASPENITAGCRVFTVCGEPSQPEATVEVVPSLMSEPSCTSVLASGCESVVEQMQVPLDACGCPSVYTTCFREGDTFDEELTVYEFSCRTQSSDVGQMTSTGLPLITTSPVHSFLTTSSNYNPSFPRSVLSSSASELSPLLSPLSDGSDYYLSQTHKESVKRLSKQNYPDPPTGFQVLRGDVNQLLAILESNSIDHTVENQRGRHPRDTCPTHFTENKQVLQIEARRLMAGCHRVVGIGQGPEMLHSLADSFNTLVGLASLCLLFSSCDRCERRNAEAVSGLTDVARSFRDFCVAAERASSKRSCQDLSTKLLAKQCTALTASVFCLTQLFRTLTAL